MNDREKYRAKIETQMRNFNQTIEELATKAKLRKDSQTDIDIESLLKKHEDAKVKLKELDTTNENNWQKVKGEVDDLFEGIDHDLRQAMAYFG